MPVEVPEGHMVTREEAARIVAGPEELKEIWAEWDERERLKPPRIQDQESVDEPQCWPWGNW